LENCWCGDRSTRPPQVLVLDDKGAIFERDEEQKTIENRQRLTTGKKRNDKHLNKNSLFKQVFEDKLKSIKKNSI